MPHQSVHIVVDAISRLDSHPNDLNKDIYSTSNVGIPTTSLSRFDEPQRLANCVRVGNNPDVSDSRLWDYRVRLATDEHIDCALRLSTSIDALAVNATRTEHDGVIPRSHT